MKAIDFLNKLKSENKGGKRWVDKERFLWYFLQEVKGDRKADVYIRPYKLENAIAYYCKRTKKGFLTPITEDEYYATWEQINKEKKIHGKAITPSPSIRFVYYAVVPAELNGIEEDKLLIVECSKTEFERLVELEKNTLNGNFGDYFKEVGKTPEEMGIVIRRYYNNDKVPFYEYVIKFTSKGIQPVTYEFKEEDFVDMEIDLERYYHPKTNNMVDNIEIEEVKG